MAEHGQGGEMVPGGMASLADDSLSASVKPHSLIGGAPELLGGPAQQYAAAQATNPTLIEVLKIQSLLHQFSHPQVLKSEQT
jgi:hypothetical protein